MGSKGRGSSGLDTVGAGVAVGAGVGVGVAVGAGVGVGVAVGAGVEVGAAVGAGVGAGVAVGTGVGVGVVVGAGVGAGVVVGAGVGVGVAATEVAAAVGAGVGAGEGSDVQAASTADTSVTMRTATTDLRLALIGPVSLCPSCAGKGPSEVIGCGRVLPASSPTSRLRAAPWTTEEAPRRCGENLPAPKDCPRTASAVAVRPRRPCCADAPRRRGRPRPRRLRPASRRCRRP